MGEAGEAKGPWAKMTVDERSPWNEVEVAHQVTNEMAGDLAVVPGVLVEVAKVKMQMQPVFQ